MPERYPTTEIPLGGGAEMDRILGVSTLRLHCPFLGKARTMQSAAVLSIPPPPPSQPPNNKVINKVMNKVKRVEVKQTNVQS